MSNVKTEALNSAFKIREEIASNYDLARSTNDVPAEEYYKYLIEDIEKIIECIKEEV